MKNLLGIFIFFTCLIACKEANTSKNQPFQDFDTNRPFTIKKFVDGDTFWVNDGTEDGRKIRLIGIDAPESYTVWDVEEEPFGKESAVYIKQLIGNQPIRLRFDVEKRDRYNRILAYAFLEDGTFINLKMVEDGYAVPLTIPPNVKHADEFQQAQKRARANRQGMWNESTTP